MALEKGEGNLMQPETQTAKREKSICVKNHRDFIFYIDEFFIVNLIIS
jgi:hypothetical protein